MANKANVPIVPISISNTHEIMPSNALFPFQKGKGRLHVHVHEPIYAEGRNEKELAELVKEKLLSRMPLTQHPVVLTVEEIEGDGDGDGDINNDDGGDSKENRSGESPKELQSA
jgi:1-acyl-sn-glycerol-3-phosphate acyltransferase